MTYMGWFNNHDHDNDLFMLQRDDADHDPMNGIIAG